ncbi:M23 family metallopeptidase [Paraburkholderia sp. Ac-20342]|uniref:M23 family metallopeptidase n=1 Tax=Paraburkholderia sp. Ac-20342 TaxID=2703889 RepID=UPI0019804FD6|nr:M23 family metallopeptidase [Paraburkholderia sp. Ac-20342]MBN3847670.1 M23 family metallopeptidase [Paraburkholderia sp. Ac-20342]
MAAPFRLGSGLASGSLRFVTRRTALSLALGAACGTAVVAVGAGIAIGMHWPVHEAAVVPQENHVERDYRIAQLGELNASVAQIEPRIARLTAEVDTLRDFETRLSTLQPTRRPAMPRSAAPASAASDGESDMSATDGEGGPALPPRGCDELAGQARGRADAQRTREQLSCIDATLSQLERQTARHAVVYAAFPGRMPVDGARFGSPFGNRSDPFTHRLSFHPGVDLVAGTGTPILAAAGGRVIFAGEKSGYGNAIDIDHGNGFVTRYGHASRLVVHAGELVLPRQHIGDVGSTGRSTGPHLHFEVRVNGEVVNPVAYLALFAPPAHG